LPNASQVTIDGGHDLHFDNPEAVAKEIRTTLGEAD
jgi:pimeloyl-ACP methyl ester carboxylesterase